MTDTNTKMQKDGVMIIKPWKKQKTRWTSTSALARQIIWLEHYQTTVGSLREKGEKQILSSNISEATGRCSDRWHSTWDYSQVVWN